VLYASACILGIWGGSFGHATKTGASVTFYLHPDSFGKNLLPSEGEPLYNLYWAIADGKIIKGFPNENFTVSEEPYRTSAEYGEEVINRSVEYISELVRNKYNEINK